MSIDNILWIVFGIGIGFVLASWLKIRSVSQKVADSEREGNRVLEDARHRADTILKEAQVEAKDILFKLRNDFDNESKKRVLS